MIIKNYEKCKYIYTQKKCAFYKSLERKQKPRLDYNGNKTGSGVLHLNIWLFTPW